jgi:hypothetical protein
MTSETERDVPQFIDDAIIADLLFSAEEDAVRRATSTEIQRVSSNIDAALAAARTPDRVAPPTPSTDGIFTRNKRGRLTRYTERGTAPAAASLMFYAVIAASALDLSFTLLLTSNDALERQYTDWSQWFGECRTNMYDPVAKTLRSQADEIPRFTWLGADPRFAYYYDSRDDRVRCVVQRPPPEQVRQTNDETPGKRIAIALSIIAIGCSGLGLIFLHVGVRWKSSAMALLSGANVRHE